MKKNFVAVLAALALFSCGKKQVARIDGKIEGAANGALVLKVLDVSKQSIVDTLKYDKDGRFSANVKLRGESPDFYYLYYNDNKVGSFVLVPGDKVKTICDTTGKKHEVSGSDESRLLVSLEKRLSATKYSFDSLMALSEKALSSGDEKKAEELNYELGSLYVKAKQGAIKHLYTNPSSITNMILIYHSFSPQIPLFADSKDLLLFKRVYDSLSVKFPESVYLERLKEEIANRENIEMFNSKIADVPETGFPEISLPDNKSQLQKLSDLSGKVVILSFWTVTETSQRMLNQEYLDLYRKYNSQGLEIFQVSVDTDKTAWATAVKEQKLPWISVCDGQGPNSAPLAVYNVTQIPVNFLIDKSGTIVARDVYGDKLESTIAKLVRE